MTSRVVIEQLDDGSMRVSDERYDDAVEWCKLHDKNINICLGEGSNGGYRLVSSQAATPTAAGEGGP